jgi:hypothetical protein
MRKFTALGLVIDASASSLLIEGSNKVDTIRVSATIDGESLSRDDYRLSLENKTGVGCCMHVFAVTIVRVDP